MSSTFEVPIIAVELHPHSNADTLSLVKIHGWQVVVKTEEWKNGELAAYIRPDSVVPDAPEWAFLEGKRRIRTRRFRGEWSHGLLVKAPAGACVGDEVAAQLGVTNYEPPGSRESRPSRSGRRSLWQRLVSYVKELGVRPRGAFPYYDIEHLRRYVDLLQPDEEIIVTEKIHGANALYTFRKPWLGPAKIFVRSRTLWKWRYESNWWNRALDSTPALQKFLKANIDLTVYGEVYGAGVQDLHYNATSPSFVAFDIWHSAKREWVPKAQALEQLAAAGVPIVPILYRGVNPGAEALQEMALRKSTLANGSHVSEGVVVASTSRRVILKLVSDAYLEKAAAS